MKSKVVLSTYCRIVSALTIAVLSGIFIYKFKQPDHKWPAILLTLLIIGMLFATLFYMPVSIAVDDEVLRINRPLRSKRIFLSDIVEVKLCPPTMAEHRICGSGGFFGWYGWFSERCCGKYFAYYGKASDCFLVTLRNGRKYMLGCTGAPEMVEEINSRL